MALLEIKDLRVSYGFITALKGINIAVEEGQIVTLLGLCYKSQQCFFEYNS